MLVRRLLRRLEEQSCSESERLGRNELLERFGPEVVGASILLGAGIASRAGLEERMANSRLVVVVEVPHQDWIEPMLKAAHVVFAEDAPLLEENQRAVPELRPPPIIIGPPRGGRAVDHDGPLRSARALREHRSLIGITTGASTSLPSDLLLACEERIVVGNFDPELVQLLLEHVVGSAPGRLLEPAAASAVEPVDLRIAIHRDRGAEGALDRFAAVLEARLRRREHMDFPPLENLAGYGAAAEWGLTAAADLAAYARAALPWSECEPAALLAGPPGIGKTSFAGALAR
ncbi:hypothetical protein LOK46_27700 [Methylobacterium sp. NMS14P]|uniref:hypothetical protein n=1 Tax=Methylobacterium sp. NMS14P TaxID=2894310 RepID=UPI0023580F15|nr:hypothetical protein [Methylobacterium sp. NMS14P]WCS24868.1 hypothetical protein LOK46_27700 [Methylobacterium sp. NMS14P]